MPLDGGFPVRLKVPNAVRAALSPDGKTVAYNPLPDAFTQWKNYRGGRNSEVWILDLESSAYKKIPQPDGRSNDPNPMWIGDTIYFRSDRDGEFNLYAFDPKSQAVRRLTDHRDFPVLAASAGGGRIIYEQAGRLHVYDPARNAASTLRIGIATDLAELRERYAKGARWVRSGDPSPSGQRVAVEFRGEIVTVPAEKGDPRNLTQTPGTHERLAALVAGRPIGRLSLRCLRRIRDPCPGPGRQGRGPRLQARRLRLLRRPDLVAGRSQDRLQRQFLEPVLARP